MKGGFEVEAMKGEMKRNWATRRKHSMVVVAKAMLRFNMNASGQRKVYDDVQNSVTMLSIRSSAMQLGIMIAGIAQTPNSNLPMTYTFSLEYLLTLTMCFIWPSTLLICSWSSSLALLFLSAFSWIAWIPLSCSFLYA